MTEVAAARPLAAPAGRAGRSHASLSTLAFLGFAAVTAAGLAGVGGGLFPIAYVGSAALAALIAYYRAPARYVSFVFFLWFFTPFVRRVVDLHNGFKPANPVLVAPTIATMVAVLTLFYRAKELRGALLYPFILTLSGVFYGFFIGLIKAGAFPATYALITWLGPIAFAMHLILNWRLMPALRDSFLDFLQWALPVVAGYGIYQVVMLPAWDRYWMEMAEVWSIGLPVRFGFRAFGTMNSPGPFAVVVLIGMIYLLGAARRGMMISLTIGLMALLLTRTRASWAAFIVGLLVVQFMGPVRRMGRNWFFLLFMVTAAMPVLSLDVFRDTIFNRIASLASLEEDSSVRQRLVLSNLATQALGARAEGEGLGATGGGTKLGSVQGRQASIDNGFLEVFYVLGWPGGSLVMLGLLGQLITLARFRDSREDAFANSARAVFWALLSVLFIGDIFSGAIGAMYWSAYGFACSAHAYNFATGKGLRSRQIARQFHGRAPAVAPR
ncbi:MAG: hypothetical protein P3B98_09445 [Gemmatimonadota bacterium]|nr:hypothetical protein [Gemmatimonadota bacterium]